MEEEEGPLRKRTRLERIQLDTLGIEELREVHRGVARGDRAGRGGHRP